MLPNFWHTQHLTITLVILNMKLIIAWHGLLDEEE